MSAQHKYYRRLPEDNRYRERPVPDDDRVYTPDEIEFMMAMEARKERERKVMLTCPEILEEAEKLGYRRLPRVAADEASNP